MIRTPHLKAIVLKPYKGWKHRKRGICETFIIVFRISNFLYIWPFFGLHIGGVINPAGFADDDEARETIVTTTTQNMYDTNICNKKL